MPLLDDTRQIKRPWVCGIYANSSIVDEGTLAKTYFLHVKGLFNQMSRHRINLGVRVKI